MPRSSASNAPNAVNGPAPESPHYDVLLRGRRNIAIDLKHPDGVATLLDLVASADGLIEGFRPKRDGTLGHRARRMPRSATHDWSSGV